MNKDCFKHALYFGLMMAGLFVLHFMLSTQDNGIFILGTAILQLATPIVAIALAIDCRKTINNNSFTYGQSMQYFWWLFSSASLVATAIIFAYTKWINTTLLINLQNRAFEVFSDMGDSLTNLGITQQQVEVSLNNGFSPKIFAISNFFSYMLTSLIISLIGSFFVRKKK